MEEYRTAQDIAVKGHKAGAPVMTYLYAYILACQEKISEALSILKPLADRGNAVATGLYGIIGMLATTKTDPVKEHEMVRFIEKSAEHNFSAAQYFIGRWLIDGQSGFSVDIDKGLDYIFKSTQRGFLPSMYYLRKALKRDLDTFVSVRSMVDLMNIALNDFSEENFPVEMIRAIAVAD